MAQNAKLFNFIIRSYKSKARSIKYNTGIHKRLSLIEETNPDRENVDIDEQTLENLENAVLDVNTNKGKSKNGEMKDRAVMEYKKIERKFFKKQICPNLLSWSEKEQIRYLYNTDPKIWSPIRLSECFPATADIIKKIVKSQWKPISSDRIIQHDKSVSDNWSAIESGHIKLPVSLDTHIRKFVSRKKVTCLNVPDKSLEEVQGNSSRSSEFLNIVKLYKSENEKHNLSHENKTYNTGLKPNQRCETYVLKQKSNISLKYKYYTLQQLKKELVFHSPEDHMNGNKDYEVSCVDKESEPKVNADIICSDHSVNHTNNNKSIREIVLKNKEDFEIPLKISIPKEKLKCKTHVYKVKDCFYNNQGEFLYKVPGMV